MKIINANAILMDTMTVPYENETPYEFIEHISRTCYKSENNITPNSAIQFVQRMVKNKHYAMLEHYRIILELGNNQAKLLNKEINSIKQTNPNADFTFANFLKITPNSKNDKTIISGSFRTWLEITDITNSEPEFNYMILTSIQILLAKIYPELYKKPPVTIDGADIKIFKNYSEFLAQETDKKIIMAHMPHTVKFICDRGVTHELVRHRPASFAQESTRFCNYSKDKFNNEITVIKPFFYKEHSKEYKLWYNNAKNCEDTYFALLALGAKPEESRDSLPASVKTELFITATEDEWQHIIDLRYHGTTGVPHPQTKEVMNIIYPKLLNVSNNRLQ